MSFLPEITTFFLAMVPVGELRISLPVALTVYHLNPIFAYFISVLGNLVPVVILLLFLETFSHWLSKRFKIFQKIFLWLFQRTHNKFNGKIQKYGYPALTLFVAIPLPFTGGWTGSLIAFLFGIPFKKAFLLITLGLLVAGFIVLGLTQAGILLERYFGWQVFLGLLISVGFGWLMYKMKLKNKKILKYKNL